MKRTSIDSSLERQFLIAMVTSTPFIAAAAPLTELDLLQTKYVRQVADWAIVHFRKYGKAPGKSIVAVYHAWVENEQPDSSDASAVHAFLEVLSGESDATPSLNVPHLLDKYSEYLTLKKVALLKDNLEAALMYGRLDDALNGIQTFRTVTAGDKLGYNPIAGKKITLKTYADPAETIIPFPADAGRFFNPALTRDSLVGIQAPEKRGKTWWCFEFIYRTLRAGRKVAMFQVGDLSESQTNKRWDVRIAGLPLFERDCHKDIQMPSGVKVVEDAEGMKAAQVKSYPLKFTAPVDRHSAARAHRRFHRTHKLDPAQAHVMFSVHANGTINVAGIHAILERWRHELAFVPDVIAIDYADILAPENPRQEFRHQVNETWKALRRLSQEWHSCVIVPTQADASAYNVKTQRMGNFSEDKRKMAHVTGMLGLNQTEEEKRQGVMRLNWLVLRESDFNPANCLWVAQCLPLGMAMVKASF